MRRKTSRKNLIKKLDSVFSEYIRRKYADKKGMVKCYTCNKSAYWKGQGMQNGHFISRASRILRWDEDKCRPQCYGCNCMRYGQQYIFAQNLNKEFGYADLFALICVFLTQWKCRFVTTQRSPNT